MLGILVSLLASTTGPGWKLIARCGGQQKEFEVDDKCAVTINGEVKQLNDLQANDNLEIDGQPAVCIKATRPLMDKKALHAEVHTAAKKGFSGKH